MKYFSLLCLIGFAGFFEGNAFFIGGWLQSTKDEITEVAKGVPGIGGIVQSGIDVVGAAGNLIPMPEAIFGLSKNLLAGYPFEVVSTAINIMCSLLLSSGHDLPRILPDINKMQFQLRTACKWHNFPLLKSHEMWESPDFDITKKVVIFATGWTTTVNESTPIDAFAKAYNCRGDINFVALDAASYVDTLYTWSALNTEELGEYVAEGLVRLVKLVPVKNIHLIGHSLGAHIMGSAGRNFKFRTGRLIPRITGLDPAKPCFNKGQRLSGLQRGDAEFVDVIHSNPGVLGKRDPMGDVDFYPGGLHPLPKGCITVMCAHDRAWEYYEETIYPGNEGNFLGVRCSSLENLKSRMCRGIFQRMGFDVPHNIKGNYFLDVNGYKPYGKNANPRRNDAHQSCGLCPRVNKGTCVHCKGKVKIRAHTPTI